MNIMNYQCPVCNGNLVEFTGNELHPGDDNYGITLYCPKENKCTAQEVAGHGNKVKDAWEVIQLKFVKREKRDK